MNLYIRRRVIWIFFLIFAFIILLCNDIKYILNFPKFMCEFREIIKKYSKYTEDADYTLVRKDAIKEDKKVALKNLFNKALRKSQGLK